MLYGRDTTSDMEGWHGKGWYTIVMGDDVEDWTNAGTAWYDEKGALDDDVTIAKMASSPDRVAGVSSWYHGNGVLPDEVIDHGKDSWICVDTAYLDANAYHDMCLIADAKMNGTQEDIDAAIKQYEDDVAAFEDVLSMA